MFIITVLLCQARYLLYCKHIGILNIHNNIDISTNMEPYIDIRLRKYCTDINLETVKSTLKKNKNNEMKPMSSFLRDAKFQTITYHCMLVFGNP